MESVLPEDAPRIHLPLFEGPLDLLLYLIRREKIDIHDIPIAPITRQYMEYLDLMQELNLDVAGEFMVMAATLIHIKSKMLVPVEPTEAAGRGGVRRPARGAGAAAARVPALQGGGGRPAPAGADPRRAPGRGRTPCCRGSTTRARRCSRPGLYDLIAAFKELLDRRKALIAHEVEGEGQSVEQRMDELLAMIREGESLEFLELFASLETKAEMIVTFLALLELIRLKRVRVYQRGMFGPIRVFRPVGPPAEGAPAPA